MSPLIILKKKNPFVIEGVKEHAIMGTECKKWTMQSTTNVKSSQKYK